MSKSVALIKMTFLRRFEMWNGITTSLFLICFCFIHRCDWFAFGILVCVNLKQWGRSDSWIANKSTLIDLDSFSILKKLGDESKRIDTTDYEEYIPPANQQPAGVNLLCSSDSLGYFRLVFFFYDQVLVWVPRLSQQHYWGHIAWENYSLAFLPNLIWQ